jgi:hypothetical protein
MARDVRSFIPADGDWWKERGHRMAPTVVLMCGIDGCGKTVGSVLVDGETVLALIHQKHGDRTVPYTPRRSESDFGFRPGVVLRFANGETLADQQDRKFRALDRETLRYIDGDQRVAKRYDAGSMLMPLEAFGFIVCPEHGMRDLPDPEAAEADLRAFVAATRPASKRRYFMFGGNTQ